MLNVNSGDLLHKLYGIRIRHRCDGGTGVTNFTSEDLPFYQLAIALHGDPDLFIGEAMEPCVGWKDNHGLHYLGECYALGDFWDTFRIVKGALNVKR